MKWPVAGFGEALAGEPGPCRIRMRIVKPGSIHSGFYGRNWRMGYPVAAPAPRLLRLRTILLESIRAAKSSRVAGLSGL